MFYIKSEAIKEKKRQTSRPAQWYFGVQQATTQAVSDGHATTAADAPPTVAPTSAGTLSTLPLYSQVPHLQSPHLLAQYLQVPASAPRPYTRKLPHPPQAFTPTPSIRVTFPVPPRSSGLGARWCRTGVAGSLTRTLPRGAATRARLPATLGQEARKRI